MSGILFLLGASGVPSRWLGLILAALLHWVVYAWLTAPGFHYVCKCVEPLETYDVPLPEEPDPPLVAWRGDTTVTPPQPVGSSAAQARAILAQVSAANPISIRFIVDTNGRVRECNVGVQVMAADEGTPEFICNRLRALRFHPAIDRQGRPVDYVLP